MAEKKVWALLDERAGNSSQTLGVADALGLAYDIKNIRFNGFIRLPNPLLSWNALGVTRATRPQLSPPWPDITLTTARRLGLVAAYIKSQNPSTFTAQIQWPGYPGNRLDLIATPVHDGMQPSGNVMLTLGAPHRVTPAKLEEEAESWLPRLTHLPSPRIAVLIGGGANAEEFANRHAIPLATLASGLAKSVQGSLLITTSRRTGRAMTKQMAPYLDCPHSIYEWQESGDNPYYGFLGLADAVIVTGDSVSMCSEACATGKPVFIYEGKDFMSRKHTLFINSLYQRNLAKMLQRNISFFTPLHYEGDAAMIAQEIKRRLYAGTHP